MVAQAVDGAVGGDSTGENNAGGPVLSMAISTGD